jgi:hypothetical protein
MLFNFITPLYSVIKSLELPSLHIASKFNSAFQSYSSLSSIVLSSLVLPLTISDFPFLFCLWNLLHHDVFYIQHCKGHVLFGSTYFILFVHGLFNDAANNSAYITYASHANRAV